MQRYLMNTSYMQDELKKLYALHKRSVTEYGELVENLNQECTILCDLIPSYKIASSLEKEDGGTGQRKQKEVYNVQRLEHEVLTQYEHFLQLLRKLSKKSHPEQQALGSRLCARLIGSSAAEFNHSDALMSLGLDFANSKSARVAQPALKALSELLDGQTVTDTTEHIVSCLLKIVRSKTYAINPKLLNLLLHIRVAMVDMHRDDFTEEKAKEKRLRKENKELARQMQKANARRTRAEIAAKQSRVVHRIFVIYLRVLESSRTCSPAHQTKILAPTLEGLVKFAPLVNVELYQQLMQALKDLVSAEATTTTTRLHALVAVATLAQKDATATASEWRVDLSYFHEALYRCILEAVAIPTAEGSSGKAAAAAAGADGEEASQGEEDEVASRGSTSTAGSLSSQAFSIANSMAQGNFVQVNACKEWTFHVSLILRAVDLLVLSQKHLPPMRVTAILRRLLQSVPMCPPHAGMALLLLCYRITVRHATTAGLLIGGSDNIIAGRGGYNPEAQQTISANADSSFAWEIAQLRRSYHPTMRQLGETFCRHFHKLSQHQHGQAPVVTKQLDNLGPYEVLEEYDPSLGEIRPTTPLPAALKRQLQQAAKRSRAEMEGDDETGDGARREGVAVH